MTYVEALTALAAMGAILPIVLSPFLLTPLTIGSVASGTLVMAHGASPTALMRWLTFLAAIPTLGVLSAAFLLFAVLA